MITIDCENVQLQLITVDDLELVRRWRNSPHVVEYMQYQKEISTDEQKSWFDNLDKNKNLYFKILSYNLPIGVIHLKDINWENKTAEAGIFIGENDFIGTITPMISILVLMKTAFNALGLNKLFAKISKNNVNAINFNQQFGYEFLEDENESFNRYLCTKNSFYGTRSSISKVQQLFVKNAVINIYVTVESSWILEYLKDSDKMFHLFKV